MSRIVVIGGSFGALSALKVVLASLPADFPAAILIVTHIGAHSSMLPEILGRHSALPVRHAIDGEPILPGRVLLAPSDTHLTVVADGARIYARLMHGPKENHCRPAIDPLFRSAAAAFGAGTIGVILTGYLDDGTVGLQAVKARGGFAIVQDPAEAEAPDMPTSALRHVDIDRTLGLDQIAAALIELATAGTAQDALSVRKASGAVDWIDIENRITSRDGDMEDLEKIGRRSALTCPECNGALWELKLDGLTRYRCHTGHAFTARVLESLQTTAVEDALWGAIRALHEQERLFNKMGEQARESGQHESAAEYQIKAAQAKSHSQALRDLIATSAVVVKPDPS
jgi:two-component system chemotaxis response regulator CheB